MDVTEGPKPTGKPSGEVVLTGMLFPWDGRQPVLLSMPGSLLFYLPLFSTEEKLRETMKQAGVPFRSIKHVDDGAVFLASVYGDNPGALETLAVILDPYFLPSGRVRFTQVQIP